MFLNPKGPTRLSHSVFQRGRIRMKVSIELTRSDNHPSLTGLTCNRQVFEMEYQLPLFQRFGSSTSVSYLLCIYKVTLPSAMPQCRLSQLPLASETLSESLRAMSDTAPEAASQSVTVMLVSTD